MAGFKALQDLRLQGNNISSLEGSALQTCEELSFLDLSDNTFGARDIAIFGYVHQL